MGSQLLVRSFSRHGYSLLLRHVDEVSYCYLVFDLSDGTGLFYVHIISCELFS